MAEEVAALVVRFEASAVKFERQLQRMSRKLAREANSMERRAARLDKRLSGVGSKFGVLLSGRTIGAVVALEATRRAIINLVQTADRMTQIEGRFRALTGSVDEANKMVERGLQIAGEIGAPFEAVFTSLTRFTLAAAEIGATNDQVLQLTENILKLGVIGGGTEQELRAGAIQLGQALASGQLRGDELRSVLEQMPLVAKEIANFLGEGVGQMRKLAEEGKLTADVVFQALLSRTEDINTQFEAMPVTVQRATNTLVASWTRFADKIAESLGLLEGVKSVIQGIVSVLDFASGASFDRDMRAKFGSDLTPAEIRAILAQNNPASAANTTMAGGRAGARPVAAPDLVTESFERMVGGRAGVRAVTDTRTVATFEPLPQAELDWLRDQLRIQAEAANRIYIESLNEMADPSLLIKPPKGRPALDLNDEFGPWAWLDKTSKSAKATNDAMLDWLQTESDRIESLNQEFSLLGKTEREQVRSNAAFDKERTIKELLRLEQEKGNIVTEEQHQQAIQMAEAIEEMTIAMYDAEVAMQKRIDTERRYKEIVFEVAEMVSQTIIQADNLKSALRQLAIQMARMALTGSAGGGGTGGLLGKLVGSLLGSVGGGGGGGDSGLPPAIVPGSASAKGNVFNAGAVTAFASGGVVDGPRTFPMKRGIGLMGEAGPEGILPLKRGKSGRLGVEASGMGSPIVVEVNQNFALGVSETVRAEIRAETPRLVSAARAGVIEAVQRGGSMRKILR